MAAIAGVFWAAPWIPDSVPSTLGTIIHHVGWWAAAEPLPCDNGRVVAQSTWVEQGVCTVATRAAATASLWTGVHVPVTAGGVAVLLALVGVVVLAVGRRTLSPTAQDALVVAMLSVVVSVDAGAGAYEATRGRSGAAPSAAAMVAIGSDVGLRLLRLLATVVLRPVMLAGMAGVWCVNQVVYAAAELAPPASRDGLAQAHFALLAGVVGVAVVSCMWALVRRGWAAVVMAGLWSTLMVHVAQGVAEALGLRILTPAQAPLALPLLVAVAGHVVGGGVDSTRRGKGSRLRPSLTRRVVSATAPVLFVAACMWAYAAAGQWWTLFSTTSLRTASPLAPITEGTWLKDGVGWVGTWSDGEPRQCHASLGWNGTCVQLTPPAPGVSGLAASMFDAAASALAPVARGGWTASQLGSMSAAPWVARLLQTGYAQTWRLAAGAVAAVAQLPARSWLDAWTTAPGIPPSPAAPALLHLVWRERAAAATAFKLTVGHNLWDDRVSKVHFPWLVTSPWDLARYVLFNLALLLVVCGVPDEGLWPSVAPVLAAPLRLVGGVLYYVSPTLYSSFVDGEDDEDGWRSEVRGVSGDSSFLADFAAVGPSFFLTPMGIAVTTWTFYRFLQGDDLLAVFREHAAGAFRGPLLALLFNAFLTMVVDRSRVPQPFYAAVEFAHAVLGAAILGMALHVPRQGTGTVCFHSGSARPPVWCPDVHPLPVPAGHDMMVFGAAIAVGVLIRLVRMAWWEEDPTWHTSLHDDDSDLRAVPSAYAEAWARHERATTATSVAGGGSKRARAGSMSASTSTTPFTALTHPAHPPSSHATAPTASTAALPTPGAAASSTVAATRPGGGLPPTLASTAALPGLPPTLRHVSPTHVTAATTTTTPSVPATRPTAPPRYMGGGGGGDGYEAGGRAHHSASSIPARMPDPPSSMGRWGPPPGLGMAPAPTMPAFRAHSGWDGSLGAGTSSPAWTSMPVPLRQRQARGGGVYDEDVDTGGMGVGGGEWPAPPPASAYGFLPTTLEPPAPASVSAPAPTITASTLPPWLMRSTIHVIPEPMAYSRSMEGVDTVLSGTKRGREEASHGVASGGAGRWDPHAQGSAWESGEHDDDGMGGGAGGGGEEDDAAGGVGSGAILGGWAPTASGHEGEEGAGGGEKRIRYI